MLGVGISVGTWQVWGISSRMLQGKNSLIELATFMGKD
jgi:hypothetical protein